MKIYLVSIIYTYPDERMSKRFEAFEDKDSAKKYFDEFKQVVIDDLLELEGFEDVDELFNYYEETYDYDTLWGYLAPEGTIEFELEIEELNLLTWKEN